jgi:hypothetical protein
VTAFLPLTPTRKNMASNSASVRHFAPYRRSFSRGCSFLGHWGIEECMPGAGLDTITL